MPEPRKVLVLGGTGYLGRLLVAQLRDRGHDAVIAGRSAEAELRLDATDHVALSEALAGGWDVVANLAGTGLADPDCAPEVLDAVNRGIPAALGELAGRHGFRLVHAASSTERESVHSPDESEYSRTKREGRLALEASTTSASGITVARIHNVYGPDQPGRRFVASVMRSLQAGRTVTLRYPGRIRDFVYQADAVDALADLCTRERAPSTVEIGTGVGTSLRAAACTIADAIGVDPALVEDTPDAASIDPNPVTVAGAGARPGASGITLVTGIRLTAEGMACAGS